MKIFVRYVLVSAGAFLTITSASAQNFSIDWFAVGGGGGMSTGGVFAVSGTLGQADASVAPLSGGTFSLSGGFWSFVALQTPGAPLLSIQRLNSSLRLSWPRTDSTFVLDESPSAPGAWSPVSSLYVTNATEISVTFAAPATNRFFRLRQP